ncbi:MAG: DinB family protein [Bacteroidetes bacterium]|nr:DinB family protein [Bacteroidota bacterium]
MTYNLADAINLLSRTPATLSNMLKGLPEAWIHNNEGPDTWSPFDVVGHLIHGEETDWIPRAKIILSDQPNKKFEAYDRFAQFEKSKGKTLDELLMAFAERRKENLETLRLLNIQKSDYSKTGIHPTFGEVSLKQLLSTWVVHDLNHIAQISRVLAKNYKDEMGPWTAFVSVVGN